MTQKIDLNGGWAILRDPAAVPVKLRRPIEKTLMAIGRGQAQAALESNAANPTATMTDEVIDQFYLLNDLLIVARVESWSFDGEISLDSLGSLSDENYKALQAICAQNMNEMVPNFGMSNDANSPS